MKIETLHEQTNDAHLLVTPYYNQVTVCPEDLCFDYYRTLPDGRVLTLLRMNVYWHLRISQSLTIGWYDNHWDFLNFENAIEQIATWDPAQTPEPIHWNRNMTTGRRRPDTTPASEYIERT